MPTDHQAIFAESVLPSSSGVTHRVLGLLNQDATALPAISQTLGADPVMTGRLIRLANSAAYGGRSPAASLGEALQRVGLNALRQTLISFAVIERHQNGECRDFDYQLFWSQSLATALVARHLADLTRLPGAAETFTAGLLVRIGELALACVHPESYGSLHAALQDADPERICAVEHIRYQTDRFLLAEHLLRVWSLPANLCEAARACASPGRSGLLPGSMSMRLARLLELAREVGARFDVDQPEAPAAMARIRSLCADCQVPVAELNGRLAAIHEEWREWGRYLNLVLRATGPSSLDAQAAAEIIPFPGPAVLPLGGYSGSTDAAISEDPHAAADLGFTPLAPLAAAPEGAPATSAAVIPIGLRASESRFDQAFAEALRRLERMRSLDCVEAAPATALRILLAQPDCHERDALFTLLNAQGHTLFLANTGGMAVDVYKRDAPHIVLCDHALRDMDALTLVHCLRNLASGRELYILMVGPRDQAGALEASFGAGADDFLGSPVRSGELLSRLRGARRFIELLDRWRTDHDEMRRLAAMLADANTRLESLVETDELTGIPNRRRASEQLVRAVADAEQASSPLSVFLLDLDNFRTINSTWGEGVGDEVLRRTARTLQDCVRSGDVVARFAGEEFMVIAPGMSPAAATTMAERLRLAISQQTVRIAETEINVTLSVGASVYEPAVSRRRTPEGLLHLADEALLRAKDGGRNRVCIATERPAASG